LSPATSHHNFSVIISTNHDITTSFEFDAHFAADATESDRIHIFTDRFLNYLQLDFSLSFPSVRNFTGIRVLWTTGDADQVVIQSGFRILYSLSNIVCLLLFFWRLRRLPFQLWHLEQQLTFFLLIFAILADDPFYVWESLKVSKFGVWGELFFSAVFRLYLQFFVLVLFDSLRFKNRNTVECFCLSKLVFFVPYLAIEVLDEFARESDIFVWRVSQKFRNSCDFARLCCQVVCGVWIAIAILLAGRFTDVTERYKFWVYAGVFAVALSVAGTLAWLFRDAKWLLLNSVPFVAPFSIQNIFVMLMALFHSPYEVVVDQQYEDSAAGEVQEDLIVER
jgi:hypothetical protein